MESEIRLRPDPVRLGQVSGATSERRTVVVRVDRKPGGLVVPRLHRRRIKYMTRKYRQSCLITVGCRQLTITYAVLILSRLPMPTLDLSQLHTSYMTSDEPPRANT